MEIIYKIVCGEDFQVAPSQMFGNICIFDNVKRKYRVSQNVLKYFNKKTVSVSNEFLENFFLSIPLMSIRD